MHPRSDLLRLLAILLLLVTVPLLSACDDDDDDSPTDPGPPVEVPTVTETFQGRVAQQGSSPSFFMVANPGPIELTLSDLAPLATITMGLGIGNPDETDPDTCALFATDNAVRSGATLRATAATTGTFCATVFDVGNIFEGEEISYTLTVTHP